VITKKETPPCRAGQRQTITTQSYKYRVHGFQGYFNMEPENKQSLSHLYMCPDKKTDLKQGGRVNGR
jgi:hypothetical protein